ncbi:hypothetical protein [Plantactinospora sonchi]|uniref:Uncharacterized protein n=1 Tax=Plantactinospora sonchi TaxID=1544735 RepID=A0ABU7S0V9_9ACTN
MELVLDPPRSVGPITLGMSFSEAEHLLREVDGYQPPQPGKWVNAGYFSYESGLALSVGQDRAGFVEVVEVWRPSAGVVVLFQGISLFELPADVVMKRLATVARVVIEDNGAAVVAPELLLALWRPGVPDDPEDFEGMFFQSALVAAPGYYDRTPDRFAEVKVETSREQQIDGQETLF